MNFNFKNIDIYPEDYAFESSYLPLISFKTDRQRELVEEYIFKKVDIFFKRIINIDISVRESQVTYPKIITEKDFKTKKLEYFYKNIFSNLGQRDSNGKLQFSPKWGITFDKKCTPISVSRLKPNFRILIDKKSGKRVKEPNLEPFTYYHHNIHERHYHYGTIDINGKPVFYYIYFTLQELLDVLRDVNV
ncbi:MAG: hypothetical protein J7647_17955 [Cyanobacteria bacterium SBLK]|nr:hypothetical protein [Cyanobacteria bacterium SBLK]